MTGDWKHMGNDHDSSHISMRTVGEILKYYARDPRGSQGRALASPVSVDSMVQRIPKEMLLVVRRSSSLAKAIGIARSIDFLAVLIFNHFVILRM